MRRVSLLLALALASCAHRPTEGIVTRADRNSDGRPDVESHRFPGTGNPGYSLVDTNFDGAFDVRVTPAVTAMQTLVAAPMPR